MAINDVVNTDGSLNIKRLGEYHDEIADIDAQLADIATVNVKTVGAIADKITDNTTLIQTLINGLTPPAIVYIPLSVKWNYNLITHPYNITIIDRSTYDYDSNVWTAQQKEIINADSPGTKNANENILVSPYHPAQIVDVRNSTGRTSYIHRRQGVGTWQEMSDLYLGHNLYSIKDLASQGAPNVFNILGGPTSKNEMGFNNPPLPTVTRVHRSRVDGTNMLREVASSTEQNTMYQIFADTLETHRIHYLTNGEVEFESRVGGSKKVTLKPDGRIALGLNGNNIDIGLNPTNEATSRTWKRGDVWFNPSPSEGTMVGMTCTEAGTPGVWQVFGQAGNRTNAGTPVSILTPRFVGEEVLDTTNGIWYKSISLFSGGWKALNS